MQSILLTFAFLTLGFWLLLPFFALLIWLRFLAYPAQLPYNLNLAGVSCVCAMASCAVATRYSWVGTSHRIWPLVQGAIVALFVFLLVFGVGWFMARKTK